MRLNRVVEVDGKGEKIWKEITNEERRSKILLYITNINNRFIYRFTSEIKKSNQYHSKILPMYPKHYSSKFNSKILKHPPADLAIVQACNILSIGNPSFNRQWRV